MEWITIFAVLLSPIFALQISKRLELQKEKRDRKLYIFKTLMTTRALRLSVDRITALNMIDVEFYGTNKKDEAVIEAWKLYRDNLNDSFERERDIGNWGKEGDKLFTDLLQKIAVRCKYNFDKSTLGKPSYYPVGHETIEIEFAAIRGELAKIVTGQKPLPIWVMNQSIMESPKTKDKKNRAKI